MNTVKAVKYLENAKKNVSNIQNGGPMFVKLAIEQIDAAIKILEQDEE